MRLSLDLEELGTFTEAGCQTLSAPPEALVHAVTDGFGHVLIEVDMTRFARSSIDGVNNHLMKLELMEEDLTGLDMSTGSTAMWLRLLTSCTVGMS